MLSASQRTLSDRCVAVPASTEPPQAAKIISKDCDCVEDHKNAGPARFLYVGLLLLITIIQISSCRATDPELERNRQLWREAKIADYNFVIVRHQGGVYWWAPVLIQVRDGNMVSSQPTEKVEELVMVDYAAFDTIEKTFSRIHESYEKGDEVTVTYSEELGYPEKIKIQPKAGGVDTFYVIEISKFEVVRKY